MKKEKQKNQITEEILQNELNTKISRDLNKLPAARLQSD